MYDKRWNMFSGPIATCDLARRGLFAHRPAPGPITVECCLHPPSPRRRRRRPHHLQSRRRRRQRRLMPTTPTRNLTSDNGVSFYTRPGLPSSPAPSLQGRPLTANSSSLSPHTTTPTRSPLAPLPPQLFTMPPESQHRSPAGGPSASSYGRNEEPGGRSNGSKISAKLAGNIIDRPMFDVEEVPKSPGLQPPRRKGAASQ